MYDCKQLREILINSAPAGQTTSTFQAVANSYITELIEDGRENYAKLLERNCRYFTEFTKGEFLLSEITPEIISNLYWLQELFYWKQTEQIPIWDYGTIKIRISILCQFLCLRKITLVTTTVKNPKKVKRFCFYVVGC